MAKFFDALTETLREFMAEQKIFFVATAPTDGRVNLSPKGMDALRCLDERTVAYLDVTGSGNETAAHIADNGRLTMMFCSFTEKPLILRLYGRGESITPRHPQWSQWSERFPTIPGARQVIVLHVESAQTSCGMAVPFFDFVGERDSLSRWAQQQGEAGLDQYRRDKNRSSIDGLPTGLFEVVPATD